MPKKKASRPTTKRKKTAAKKTAPKKRAGKEKKDKRQLARKKAAAKTKATPPKKKALRKPKAVGKIAAPAKPTGVVKKRVVRKPAARESQTFDVDATDLQERRSRSAGQSGDLQGLPGHQGADSESVDELLEEGNAFEADAVSGVEAADDADEQEVHTHEVPEDDVPGEYLDEE
jgi:hypothetical protein